MAANSSKKWLWGCGIAVPVVGGLLIVAGYITFLTNCTILQINAFYGGVEFFGHDDSYSMVSTFSPEQCQLYLDIPGHGPVLLKELEEEMLSDPEFERSLRSDNFYDTVYNGRGGSFKFKNGKLTAMHFSGGEIRFSNHRDGPWLQLPVSSERLNEVFGPPDQKSRRRVERPIRWT